MGQAYIEAVLCLESARKYLDGMNIRGNEARTILAQSQWLISTLAAMHDEQEIMTIQQLLDGAAFDYPAVTIDDIIAGKFAIPPDHLDLTEVHGVKRVGFKDLPKVQSKFETPKEMCPAHRIKDADGARLNDTFWKLLVDVYALSGEFEEGKPEAN